MTAKHTKQAFSKRHTHRSIPDRKQEASDAQFSKKAFKSFLITLAVGAFLLLIASLGIYFLPNPSPLIRPIGIVAAALTALLGGFAAGKVHGHAPAVCGLLNGIFLTILMLLLSLFFRSMASGYTVWISLLLHTMVPLLSFLGAALGVRKKPTPKHKKRRR